MRYHTCPERTRSSLKKSYYRVQIQQFLSCSVDCPLLNLIAPSYFYLTCCNPFARFFRFHDNDSKTLKRYHLPRKYWRLNASRLWLVTSLRFVRGTTSKYNWQNLYNCTNGLANIYGQQPNNKIIMKETCGSIKHKQDSASQIWKQIIWFLVQDVGRIGVLM